ncbi:MAG: hypothetical protein KGZ75_01395 [Syntrophomonadaceae bacterium]|nr:hypothetical protein [Syntrophomonadaceae bacterium]
MYVKRRLAFLAGDKPRWTYYLAYLTGLGLVRSVPGAAEKVFELCNEGE